MPKSPRQQRRHPVVGLDAIDQVAGVALAEEGDRQAQHMPDEARRLLERQPQLDAQQRELLQRACSSDAQHERHAETDQQRAEPALELLDQDLVDEDRVMPGTTRPGTTSIRPIQATKAMAGSKPPRRRASRATQPGRRRPPRVKAGAGLKFQRRRR